MATYDELAALPQQAGFGTLQGKVRVAVAKKAQVLLDGATPTAAQVRWALSTLTDPAGASGAVLLYVIAANSAATVSQILSASDAAVQSNVNSAVDAITSVSL